MLCTAGSLENAYKQTLKSFRAADGLSMCELGLRYGEKAKKARDEQKCLLLWVNLVSLQNPAK